MRTPFSMVLVLTTPVLPTPALAVFDAPGRVPQSVSASMLALESDLVGTVDQSTGLWSLRGVDGGTFTFYYGNPGDLPFAGDWDCDGVDTPGLYRQSDGFVYLRNANSQGNADITFFFGNPGDVPIAGDFNDNGCDTVSIYRPSQGRVFIVNELGEDGGGLGAAELDYYFGNPGDTPFTGDFDNDGTDTVGLYRQSTGEMYFRNSHTLGNANFQFFYGNPGDRFVGGDWTADGTDTPGVFRPSEAFFHLKHTNTQGIADESFAYGSADSYPVAGKWGDIPAVPPMSFTHPGDGDTVFHTETVTVSVGEENGGSVDLLVDGATVASAPISGGSASFAWDTTTVADGGHALELIADFASGGIGRAAIGVDVANGLESQRRLDVELAQGDISIGDYAVLTTEAILVPNRLPPEYGQPQTGVDSESTAELLNIAYAWESLDANSRELFEAYWDAARALQLDLLRGDPSLDPRTLGGAATGFNPASGPTTGCDQCMWDSAFFTIYYTTNPSSDDRVPSTDVKGYDYATRTINSVANGVPDRIDDIARRADEAVDYYSDTLGYVKPPGTMLGRIQVYVQDSQSQSSNATRGDIVSPVGWDIFLYKNASNHTIRHEVFHHVQFSYFNAAQWCSPGTSWFLEGSAQWAGHQAGVDLGPDSYAMGRYASRLPAFLGTPSDALIEGDLGWCGLPQFRGAPVPDRAYGSFIFSEYLSDRFDRDIIKELWEELSFSVFNGAERTIWRHDYGFPYPEVLSDFWVASYGLTNDPVVPEPWRFVEEPHIGEWRKALASGNTDRDGVAGPRPYRTHRNMDIDGSAAQMQKIAEGGAAYLDLTGAAISGARLDISIRDKAGNPGLAARIVGYDDYPELCSSPVELPTDGTHVIVTLPSDCTFATVVMVNHGDSRRREAVWDIHVLPAQTRLVANAFTSLWEFDGSAWSQLASSPVASGGLGDIVEFRGTIYARVVDFDPFMRSIRRLNDDGSWTTLKTFGPNETPGEMAVANEQLYVSVGVGPDPRRTRVLRYDGASGWTTVVERIGWNGGIVAMEFGDKEELVLVTQVDLVGLNPSAAEIFLYSETDGLRQGSFATADGPTPKLSPRFGVAERVHATLGGQQLLGGVRSAPFGRDRILASSDGMSWGFLDEPNEFSIFVMETHMGLVHFAGWAADDLVGLTEQPIRVYDGTTIQTLVDPPNMAWRSFVADERDLFLAGSRDVDFGPLVEVGVYRLVDGKRVSISNGTPVAGQSILELLVRGDS